MSVIDRSRGARDTARRRAAAGMNLLAKADLDAQHVGRGLRPERVGGTGPVSPAITSPSISFFSMPVLSSNSSKISPESTQTSRSLFSITLVSA